MKNTSKALLLALAFVGSQSHGMSLGIFGLASADDLAAAQAKNAELTSQVTALTEELAKPCYKKLFARLRALGVSSKDAAAAIAQRIAETKAGKLTLAAGAVAAKPVVFVYDKAARGYVVVKPYVVNSRLATLIAQHPKKSAAIVTALAAAGVYVVYANRTAPVAKKRSQALVLLESGDCSDCAKTEKDEEASVTAALLEEAAEEATA